MQRMPNGRFDSIVELLTARDGSRATVLGQLPDDSSVDQAWPPCPPVQECLNHSGMENVLLTTGMAGKAHWSSAIESKESDGVAFIEWDVACRTSTRPEFLGSVWQVASGASALITGDGVAKVDLAGESLMISAADGATIDVRQENERTLVVITCTDDSDELPRTFRWKYRIGVPAAAS